ncbi:MAG: hypothetical protein ACP5O2_07320 [Bacteroidales bacterium]
MTTTEGLREATPLLKPIHFLMPFLAHALGTFVGSFITARTMARPIRMFPSLIVGLTFLVGGVLNVTMIPAPIWFDVVDLTIAYLPMAWMGYGVARKIRTSDN